MYVVRIFVEENVGILLVWLYKRISERAALVLMNYSRVLAQLQRLPKLHPLHARNERRLFKLKDCF